MYKLGQLRTTRDNSGQLGDNLGTTRGQLGDNSGQLRTTQVWHQTRIDNRARVTILCILRRIVSATPAPTWLFKPCLYHWVSQSFVFYEGLWAQPPRQLDYLDHVCTVGCHNPLYLRRIVSATPAPTWLFRPRLYHWVSQSFVFYEGLWAQPQRQPDYLDLVYTIGCHNPLYFTKDCERNPSACMHVCTLANTPT